MTAERVGVSERLNTHPNVPVNQRRSIFSVPPAIKRVFDRFPLITFDPNQLPQRSRRVLSSPEEGERHTLFIWTAEGSCDDSLASFNPACLKWQVYLKYLQIPLHIVSSNNHASPSGSLPFLLPNPRAPKSHCQGIEPYTASKLERWAVKREQAALSSGVRLQYELRMSLIDGPVRRAWLYHMYLTPNFSRFTVPAYIHTQSSSSIVRAVSARELRQAAMTELLKYSSKIHEDTLYFEAEEALGALDAWAADLDTSLYESLDGIPLFHAALFSYTYLLLEPTRWAHARLPQMLKRCESLRRWNERIKSEVPDLRAPEIWTAWADEARSDALPDGKIGNGAVH